MKVAVIGAGALGGVYGVRLAVRAGVDVTFVVRRVGVTDPLVIESVRNGEREEIAAPVRAAAVPADADVILIAVGTEDLGALRGALATSEAPIVVLTPMLPRGWAAMRAAYGERAHAAMPSVVSYARHDDGVLRYWTPPAPTKIDEPRPTSPYAEEVAQLAEALSRAGLRTELELGVHEKNPASTVRLIAIGMVLSVAGSVDALLEDDTLLGLATAACREGARLSERIGAPEPWALLSPVLSAPWALRLWLRGLGRISPEALFYAEEHFGRKLRAQHQAMIHEMIELAVEKALPRDALVELARRLDASTALG